MGECGLGGLDLHFAGIHAPPAPIIALDVLFTRLAWQTKVKIITENEKPKQRPAAFPAIAGRCFPPRDRLPQDDPSLLKTTIAQRDMPLTPAPARPALVVFDLDGTLLDTHVDLVESLNHTIAALDLEPVSYDDLTHLVGQGARVMIERACRLRGHPLEGDALPLLVERFVAHYAGNMPGRTEPYPGLVAAMDRLRSEGYRLAVCTNKMESLALGLLDKLDLVRYFDAISGGDTFPVRKPDARHLTGTIERAGGDIARTVMIGDSINDIAVAKNAGVPSIAVPFGYSDVPVSSLDPDVIITHFDELTPQLIERLLQEYAEKVAV
jgi:phosphoglycolate phosphatase